MLTFPASYSSALSSPFKENWIVRLYSDSSTYIGISFANITMNDSTTYHGCIKNNPSIRESINLDTGKTLSSNMNLECSNITIGSDKLSKHLYTSGSTSYINKTVKIYSVLNGDTTIANALAIYTGRLIGVSVGESGAVKLKIVSYRPWDGVQLPIDLTNNGVYVPVAYGDYHQSNTGYSNEHRYYPVPYVQSAGSTLYYATHDTISSDTKPRYYDKGSDAYGYMTDASAENGTVLFQGKQAVRIDNNISRYFRLKPSYSESTSSWSNTGNAVDSSTSTATTSPTITTSGGNLDQSSIYTVTVPSVNGYIHSCTLYIKGTFTATNVGNSACHFRIGLDYGGSVTYVPFLTSNTNTTGTQNITTSGSADIDGSGTAHKDYSMSSTISSNNNKLPDSIKLQIYNTNGVGDQGDTVCSVSIEDIWLLINAKEDYANEPTSSKKEVTELDVIYMGNDGFKKSWDTSTLITEIHDMHRDILYRYLGVESTPVNWTALDSAKDWKGRFYTEPNKPDDILKHLEKLAYEGGFTFRFDSTGEPCYNFIPNSLSADMTITHSQIAGLQINHIPFPDVVTDWTVQYQKKPSGKNWASSSSYTDSDARTLYSFGTGNVNKRDIKLNYLIDSVDRTGNNRNDSFLDYYSSILGDLKQVISFELLDPTKSNLDVGDIVTFSSMSTDKLDGSWSGSDYFIVTDTQRSVGGKLKVKAREI